MTVSFERDTVSPVSPRSRVCCVKERALEFRFNADEWQRLTNGERVNRCRLMAEQASVLAQQAPPELKEGYLSLSGDWLKLAAEMERTAR